MTGKFNTTMDVGPEFWPKDFEAVKDWGVEDWEFIERAVIRLRVRPADRPLKERLLRGINGELARWIQF